MNPDVPDEELLREFVQNRSDSAFRTLTGRHVDLVFGTALRATSDHPAAEEITQNVFIALAKKAAWLQREGSLAAWLHRAALMESRQWWRAESRRRVREQTAVELETIMKTSPAEAPALAGVLDDALLELNQGERQAVLLRYFEGRNHREISTALGIGEDAARKRVDKGMEQLAAFFRKRGFAVGSATVLAASIKAAVHAAPAGLAASAAQAAISAGSTVSPWLAKLLAVGKLQMAGLCVLLLLVPAAWQEARLNSARGEQRRLTALLTLLESEHAGIANEEAEVVARISRLRTEIDAVRSNSMAMSAAIEAGELDPRLFLWNEQMDFVRVPKTVLKRIRLDGSNDRWGLNGGSEKTFDSEHKRISAAVLDVMGLDAAQKHRAQEILSRHLDGYREWTATHAQPMDYPTLVATITNLPPGIKQNDSTRAWFTPEIPGGDRNWQNQFKTELAALIGDERADILLNMAHNDGSLRAALRRFGAEGNLLLVTPLSEGGFSLCRFTVVDGGSRGGNFNLPAPFSTALPSGLEATFDEAAVRQQIVTRIAERRISFPDQEIPPLDALVTAARRQWEMQHFNIIREVLREPLPAAVTDYLRQWREAHPQVPDAMNSQMLPRNP